MRTLIPIVELKVRLNAGLPEILFNILSGVKREGRGRWKGYAPNGDMIVVETAGPKRGEVFNTTGSGRGDGNLFNLILALFCNGSMGDAGRFCERILGLGSDAWQPDPARVELIRQAERDAAHESERVREKRFSTWRREYQIGTRQTAESKSGRYLHGRCCPLSSYLRDGSSPYDGQPVMLAPMLDPETLGIKAVHVTKLLERNGLVVKSLRAPVKLTSGYPRGCVIPLADGKSRLSLKQAWRAGLMESLIIAEGIENALSVHTEFPDIRLFAAGSIANLCNIVLPLRFDPVILVRDREKPENLGPAGVRARVIEQWLRQNRRVELIDPPQGFKDVNDAVGAFVRN